MGKCLPWFSFRIASHFFLFLCRRQFLPIPIFLRYSTIGAAIVHILRRCTYFAWVAQFCEFPFQTVIAGPCLIWDFAFAPQRRKFFAAWFLRTSRLRRCAANSLKRGFCAIVIAGSYFILFYFGLRDCAAAPQILCSAVFARFFANSLQRGFWGLRDCAAAPQILCSAVFGR